MIKQNGTFLFISFLCLSLISYVGCGSGSTSDIAPREVLQFTHSINLEQARDLQKGFYWFDIIHYGVGEKESADSDIDYKYLRELLGYPPLTQIAAVDETISGQCGGNVNVSSSGYNDSTGEFSIEFDFYDYDDCQATFSGIMTFSGKLNIDSGEPESFTVRFTSLIFSNATESFIVNDKLTSDFTIPISYPTNPDIDIYLIFDGSNVEYAADSFGMGYSSAGGLTITFGGF